MKTRRYVIVAIALAASSAAGQEHVVSQPPTTYTIHELPGFVGSWGSWANDLNDKGEVVGYAADDFGEYRALFWDAGGNVTNLGGTAAVSSKAYGINDAGVIVGWSDLRGRVEPAYWVNGQVHFLPVLPGHIGGVAYDIGDNGVIVGNSHNSVGDATAVRWTNGQIEALHSNHSWAFEVNGSGVATGRVDVTAWPRSVLFTKSGSFFLPNLGAEGDYAYDINDNGVALGIAVHPSDFQYHAVLWRNGQIEDLGVPPNSRSAYARGLNNHDDFVGISFLGGGGFRVFARVQGSYVDVPEAIANQHDWSSFNELWDINDRGEIIGSGNRTNLWYDRAFKLAPVVRPVDRAPERPR